MPNYKLLNWALLCDYMHLTEYLSVSLRHWMESAMYSWRNTFFTENFKEHLFEFGLFLLKPFCCNGTNITCDFFQKQTRRRTVSREGRRKTKQPETGNADEVRGVERTDYVPQALHLRANWNYIRLLSSTRTGKLNKVPLVRFIWNLATQLSLWSFKLHDHWSSAEHCYHV
jgi:hypothetical protein